MNMRYSDSDVKRPSVILLRSLAGKIGKWNIGNEPGGYGGMKLERIKLEKVLLENIDDERFSEMERDTINGLREWN